jgi:hypothetical protein
LTTLAEISRGPSSRAAEMTIPVEGALGCTVGKVAGRVVARECDDRPAGRIDLTSERRDQKERRARIHGKVLIEALGRCIEDAGLDAVGVAQHQRGQRTPFACDPLDEGGGRRDIGQVARVVAGIAVAGDHIPSVRGEPGNDGCGDAVRARRTGHECDGHVSTRCRGREPWEP